MGLVFSPLRQLSLNLDYLHWDIRNEVNQQSSDQLLRTENECRNGPLDVNSPTCVAALSQVSRDSSGLLLSISTPKINVSNETVDAFVAEGRYLTSLGRYGKLEFQFAWNDMLKHTNQIYPGDPTLDALRDPTWSTDFKSKVNATVTWSAGGWAATLYVNRNGGTPNYLATIYGYGSPGAGTLSPWTTANIGARYQWTPQLELSANLINAFDAMPPVDRSYPGTEAIPYNEFNYNVYGRAFFLGAQYRIRK